jgi:hypothetical protein
MVEYADSVGLRKEYVDTAVKAVALVEYKLRTLCTIDTSNAYTESYFRETNTDPTSPTTVATTTNIRGIPRFSPFPAGRVGETKVSALIEKYGMEQVISMEDGLMNYIPMAARASLRLGRAVSKSISGAIVAVMSASFGNTVAVTAGYEWNSATIENRNPLKNILDGIQTMRVDGINALNGNGYLVLNGDSYTDLITNEQVYKNPTFKAYDVVANGVVAQVAGLKIMLDEEVVADTGYIVIKGEAMTWKVAQALKIELIEDPGIKDTIRAYELGVVQLTAPNAVCKFTNLRA